MQEGLAIAEASVGRDHLDAAALEMRAWDQAEREVAEIERIYLRVKGAVSSELVVVHLVRGRLARARGDLSTAREHAELQLRFARETRSAEHPDVVRAHLELGVVQQRRPAEAIAVGERGLERSAKLERAEVLRAELQGWLAQAMIDASQDAGHDPARGEALAAAARSALLALAGPNEGPDGPRAADAAEALAELDAWTARRRAAPVP